VKSIDQPKTNAFGVIEHVPARADCGCPTYWAKIGQRWKARHELVCSRKPIRRREAILATREKAFFRPDVTDRPVTFGIGQNDPPRANCGCPTFYSSVKGLWEAKHELGCLRVPVRRRAAILATKEKNKCH
jgi:hypothetical protein